MHGTNRLNHEDPPTKNLCGFLETHFESPPFRLVFSTREIPIHTFVVSTRFLREGRFVCVWWVGDPGVLDRDENGAGPSSRGTSEAADAGFSAYSGAVPTVVAAV